MIDLTEILKAIVYLLLAVVSTFMIPWIKSKTTANQRKEMLEWVDIAVSAAQQLYYDANGTDRREYALDLLRSQGYDIDDTAVQDAVEAAVLKLHQKLEN